MDPKCLYCWNQNSTAAISIKSHTSKLFPSESSSIWWKIIGIFLGHLTKLYSPQHFEYPIRKNWFLWKATQMIDITSVLFVSVEFIWLEILIKRFLWECSVRNIIAGGRLLTKNFLSLRAFGKILGSVSSKYKYPYEDSIPVWGHYYFVIDGEKPLSQISQSEPSLELVNQAFDLVFLWLNHHHNSLLLER